MWQSPYFHAQSWKTLWKTGNDQGNKELQVMIDVTEKTWRWEIAWYSIVRRTLPQKMRFRAETCITNIQYSCNRHAIFWTNNIPLQKMASQMSVPWGVNVLSNRVWMIKAWWAKCEWQGHERPCRSREGI